MLYPKSRVVSHVLCYRYFSCFWQCDQHNRIRYRFPLVVGARLTQRPLGPLRQMLAVLQPLRRRARAPGVPLLGWAVVLWYLSRATLSRLLVPLAGLSSLLFWASWLLRYGYLLFGTVWIGKQGNDFGRWRTSISRILKIADFVSFAIAISVSVGTKTKLQRG